jgi:putative peptidoglycan lipid II flippase
VTPGAAPEASEPDETAKSADEGAGAGERKKLVARAGIVGLGTLASRILGLFRDMVLAAVFPRDATDAFFVAFTIPNALRQLLGEGAVSSAVVPVLSERLAEGGDEAAKSFFRKARGVSLVALTVVTVLGMVFAEPITELFASGYHARPGQFERTVHLTRTVFPYIFFMGTAALGMAALNVKRKFAVAAFAPGLLNVAFLVTSFALPGLLALRGIDFAQAIAIGALLGGALQVVAQWPALREIGYFQSPQVDFGDPHVRRMVRRILPMMAGIGVYYVDLVLSRRFLSELGEGAQSYFSWANRVCDFPQGIFVMALSTAALPSLAELAAKRDMGELAKTFAYGMRLAMFVAIPSSVALVALADPLTSLLFQRGHFTAEDAHETAKALMVQGAGVFTVAGVRQTVPVFYALGDTRTPVVVSALDLLAFIALAVGLKGSLGHVGISAAVAGSSLVQMALLLYALKKKLGDLRAREIVRSCSRTALASVVAGVGAWGLATYLTGLPTLVPGIAGGVAFVGLFCVAAWGLRSEELDALAAGALRRLRRRAAPASV